MAHTFENFSYSYWKNGKPIYAPSERGVLLGEKLKKNVANKVLFDDFVFHFKDGSHVLAMHKHRKNKYFCRVDIEKFFYSIRRNRVKRALKGIGVARPEFYAKWSTVKNPYEDGGYVLPYGFIQSPILATLVLVRSEIGAYIRALGNKVCASVYMDDICLSSDDLPSLRHAFDGLKVVIESAGFSVREDKTREPADQIDIFNCTLENMKSTVLPERIAAFYALDHTAAGVAAFESYCDIVQSHSWRIGEGRRKRKRAYTVRKTKGGTTGPDVEKDD